LPVCAGAPVFRFIQEFCGCAFYYSVSILKQNNRQAQAKLDLAHEARPSTSAVYPAGME
jgi:hypothetical protein